MPILNTHKHVSMIDNSAKKILQNRFNLVQLLLMLLVFVNASGCASLMSSAAQDMAENLSSAMLNQDDLETVRAGAPAYLIMIDGLIDADKDNPNLLLTGSRLYASYTSAFVEDHTRAKRLADKSFSYARRALCMEVKPVCQNLDSRLEMFIPVLQEVSLKQQSILYAYASAWANWIQVNVDDWNAIAQIPKLTAMFQRCIELDETFDNGGAHIYLGVLSSQIPPSLGGKPEQARLHFEKARQLSAGKNLMVNVLFAQHYARLVFDQELHDQLLQSVVTAEKDEPGFVLINTLARQQAARLLKESSDYF